jgi:hypothetical protein
MTPRPLAHAAALSLSLALIAAAPRPAAAAPGCGQEPDSAALLGSPDEIFTRARAAFDAKRFLEAGPLFRVLAMEHPDIDAGKFSVSLSLESLHQAAKEAGDACFDAMAEDVPRYLSLYCPAGGKPRDADLCNRLDRIERDIERLHAESLVQRADKEPRSRAMPLYVEAGKLYLALWENHLRDACRAKSAGCERAEEVIYNAAKAFRAGAELSKAFAARSLLFDPGNNLSNTELAKKALYEQGGEFQAVAEYARAAEYYERFAAAAPKSERAPEALQDATVLRLGLGDMAAAEKDAGLMEKNYGAKQPERVAAVDFAYALDLIDKARWADAEKFLSARQGLFEKAPILLRTRSQAALGRTLSMLGKRAAADAAYQVVVSTSLEQIAKASFRFEEPDATRELAHTLIAVGEARLYFADQARDVAMKLRVKKGAEASLAAKREAVEKAEHAYGEVFDIQPQSPPGAMVAAVARVARMRSQLWAQTYLALGPQAAEAEERKALAANRKCIEVGTMVQFVDEGSRACAAWLGRHDPQRFPALKEIVPAPRHRGGGEARSAPVGRRKIANPG